MRNPIRVKNLAARFVPLYAAGLLVLLFTGPAPAEYALGAGVLVAGGALRAWSAGHLVKTEHLTLSGPYARMRHPLYLGTLLCGTGIAVMVGGWPALAVGLAFLAWFFLRYFPRKERVESARLAERYGEAFERYRSEVPALLPRWTPWRPPPEAALPGDPERRWCLERYSQNNELGTLLALAACVLLFGLRLLTRS